MNLPDDGAPRATTTAAPTTTSRSTPSRSTDAPDAGGSDAGESDAGAASGDAPAADPLGFGDAEPDPIAFDDAFADAADAGFGAGGFDADGFGAAFDGADGFDAGFDAAGFDDPFGAASGGDTDGAVEVGAVEVAEAEEAEAPSFGSPFDAPEGDGADDADAYDVSFSEAATIAAGGAGDDGGPAGRADAGGAGRPGPKGRAKDDLVLGLHVTPSKVYGLLVRPADGGYEPLRQFVRHRSEGGELGAVALSPDDVSGDGDVLFDDADDDVQVQFETSADIDFSAEFAGLGVDVEPSVGGGEPLGEIGPAAQPVTLEVRDILEECASAGFGRPALAFAVGVPDVEYVEVDVPPERKDKKKDKKAEGGAVETAPVKRERLLEALPELSPGADRDRVAFVPMTPRDRTRRFLAVVPTASEPVAESLAMLREQGAHRKTRFRTIEAEVPLLLGLVRMTLTPAPGENTALVRVGAEDTIVLLLSGDGVQHYEKMQSVTAFDGPDTVCSRVLLQQDVQGVGVVHNVVVVSEEREKELVQGFSAFYPDARVETLREGLARFGLVGPYGPLSASLVGAAGAALAGHVGASKRGPFEDASLLPDALRKRSRLIDFSVGWHTLVVAAVLFMSVLYFSYLYVNQEGQIAEAEQRLAEFPPEARLSAPALQARIDSLRLRQANLTASLVALDSLLIDTDRWTQTLLRTTRAAAATGGAWIEDWDPAGADVTLTGFATERGRVVGLAQRLSATVEEVTYQDIRGFPVYAYRLRFTQPSELPQVARVLREEAEAAVAAAAPTPLRGLDAPAPAGTAPAVD